MKLATRTDEQNEMELSSVNCNQGSVCECGDAYDIIPDFPVDQSKCPACRAKERRLRRLIGTGVPAFLREPRMLMRQAD